MVRLGLEPGVARWKIHTIPLGHGRMSTILEQLNEIPKIEETMLTEKGCENQLIKVPINQYLSTS